MSEPLLKEHDKSRMEIYLGEQDLFLHKDIVAFFRKINIVSARALVSYLIAFPSSLLFNNFMSKSELDYFRKEVFDTLKDVLPKEAFDSTPRKMAYGALKPRGKSN